MNKFNILNFNDFIKFEENLQCKKNHFQKQTSIMETILTIENILFTHARCPLRDENRDWQCCYHRRLQMCSRVLGL